MKIYTNTKLIKRNARIGSILMVSGMVILVIGLILNFQANPDLLIYAFLTLPVGFILAQIGMFFNNRWGRRPRQEEVISQSLKGLDDRFTLYHFETPVDHLLIGPAGIWVVVPFLQRGKITFEDGKWRQKGVNVFMKYFAQEGISRPDLEVGAQVNDLKRFFEKHYPSEEKPPINSVMVFLHPKVELDASESDTPAITGAKLKDLIRKQMKTNPLPQSQIEMANNLFLPIISPQAEK